MNISNNPFECGKKLKTGFDYFAKGFNKNELVDAFYHLIADRRQGQLLLECAEFCDVDDMYNPGEEIDDEADRLSTVEGIILEAVRVKSYARTAQTMAALQKVLNKHLSGTGKDITAGDAIIGKPKKNGLFASVTVQFPLTDGQTLSIIFHSPDNNKMKITAADEIIAFRWLLNKRDITSAVSPDAAEESTLPGMAAAKDVSLEEVGTRCAQLIVKNSERFASKSAELVAAKKLKEELNTQVSGLQDSNGQLQQDLAVKIHDGELSDAQINSTQRQLEKQISYNEELRAKLEGLKATGAGNDGKAGGEDTTGGVDKAAASAALLEEKKAAFEGELTGRGFGPQDGLVASDRVLKLVTTAGAALVVTFDKYAHREGSVAMVKITTAPNSSSSTEKTFFAKTEKSLDSLYTKALAFIDKKIGEDKKIAPPVVEVENADKEGAGGLELDPAAKPEPEVIEPDAQIPEKETPPEPEVTIVDPATVDDTLGADTNPDRAEENAALTILDDIVGGKYANSTEISDKLDEAANTLERLGMMDLYDERLNAAADYLTGVLKTEAAGV